MRIKLDTEEVAYGESCIRRRFHRTKFHTEHTDQVAYGASRTTIVRRGMSKSIERRMGFARRNWQTPRASADAGGRTEVRWGKMK